MSGESKTVERFKTDLLGELHLMTPADLRAYWERVPWPKPDLVELAKSESSPLASALKQLTPEKLAQASAQLDPFGWLLEKLEVTEWSDHSRRHKLPWMTRIWLAAASQLRAQRRLIHKAHGWAETWEDLRRNQHKLEKLHYADEFYFAQLRHANEKRRAELLEIPGLDDRLAMARQENDEAFLRRFRRAKRNVAATGVAELEKYAVQHWLELPMGLPGLCFFSDSALHSLLEIFGLHTGEGLATKQVRTRLGLIQAGAKRHLIEDAIDSGCGVRFTGSMLTEPFSFKGTVSWGARFLWPQSY